AGCCALVLSDSLAELEHMWIKPDRIGNGVGRALFAHVIARAAELNLSALEISADPNAEGFYQRMGASRIGEVQANIDGQRRLLPRMRLKLNRQPQSSYAHFFKAQSSWLESLILKWATKRQIIWLVAGISFGTFIVYMDAHHESGRFDRSVFV